MLKDNYQDNYQGVNLLEKTKSDLQSIASVTLYWHIYAILFGSVNCIRRDMTFIVKQFQRKMSKILLSRNLIPYNVFSGYILLLNGCIHL